MEKKNLFGNVSLKVNAFDLLRIKMSLRRSIEKERYYCKILSLDDYEVSRLEDLLHRVESCEKAFF